MAHNRVTYTDGFFRNSRGQKLFYSAFFPQNSATDGVHGVVFFMHGINEHSQRFTHVYETLVDLGFGVIAHDMIGHGQSDCDVAGLRGHSERFHHMVDDANAFLTVAKYSIYRRMLPATQQQQQPPLYFMGISYGCLVGMHTILSGVHPFAGVVMAAPALGVEQTVALRIQSLFSGPIVKAFPHARIVPGVNFDALSRNTEFVRDYMNDKLNITDKMTARMGTLSMEAMQLLAGNKHVEDAESAFCKLPILIIQGTADKVTSVAVARAFYQRISNFDKQMKEYDGFFHCLFNEPEKDVVLEDVTLWLLARARHHATMARAIAETKQTPALPAARL